MNNYFKQYFLMLMVCSLYGVACQAEPANTDNPNYADSIFHHGKIYTVNKQRVWAEAIAIRDGRYVFVGNDQNVSKWRGPNTMVIDLKGKMLMPGINDAHSHPFGGGVGLLYNCDFEFSSTPKKIKQRLSACIKKNPQAQWLEGGQWTSDFFKLNNIANPKKFLDEVSIDVAIYLEDDSGHNAWVNSKALELAGIKAGDKDPKGGTIVRNNHGEPNGVLLETAAQIITRHIPERTVDEYAKALVTAVALLNSYGVTASNEARTPSRVLQAYVQLDLAGQLNAHINTSLQTPFGGLSEKPFNLQNLQDLHKKYQSPHVDSSFVKIFSDGVPTASRSALMLDYYTVDTDHSHKTKGNSHLSREQLSEVLLQLDQAGFTVKIHTAGDGSVRMALDAIEYVRKTTANKNLMHRLAHAGYIDNEDLPRFKALNTIADFSPYIWFPSPITDSVVNAVGLTRGKHYFPTKTLLEIGAPILAGSDWPSAVETPNPWPGIEAIISRKNPFSDSAYQDQTLWLEQAITLSQALELFTIKNAKAMKLDAKSGSVELGKSADFIVIEKNLFEIPVDQISETQILATWFEGKKVFSSNKKPH